MRVMDYEIGGRKVAFYEASDLAPCRACKVPPVYKESTSSSGDYVRCPKCGIKTGSSTAGLEALVPRWNAIMADDWPASDPKAGL